MLSENRPALSSMLPWGMALDGALGMTSRVTVSRRLEHASGLRDLAPTLTRDVVRTFAASAIGVNIALSVIDVWRLAYLPVAPGGVRAAIAAAAIAIPLHIRHVVYGLRGERPPFGAFTLMVLAIVNAVAWRVVGPAWIFQFASLAVSILIVVPGIAALVLAAVVVLSPLVLQGPQWFAIAPNLAGIYLAFSIAWRSTTQFVPLRLMAAIRALDLAGRELESRAVVQTRVRIDAELRDGVASALEQIVARGEAARRAAGSRPRGNRGGVAARRRLQSRRCDAGLFGRLQVVPALPGPERFMKRRRPCHLRTRIDWLVSRRAGCGWEGSA